MSSYRRELGSRGGERRRQHGRSTSQGRRGPIDGSLPTSPHQPNQVPANTSTYPQSIFREGQESHYHKSLYPEKFIILWTCLDFAGFLEEVSDLLDDLVLIYILDGRRAHLDLFRHFKLIT